ncbi:hypothetical protein BDZ91DRAFT_717904 [Kalaharituber pfeilii]|nr:hypothetical protein BDZ91DRAFT_717904 [Kalaharituber pfeilii]
MIPVARGYPGLLSDTLVHEVRCTCANVIKKKISLFFFFYFFFFYFFSFSSSISSHYYHCPLLFQYQIMPALFVYVPRIR